MTQEQIKHYLKGGKFTAIYTPQTLDILSSSKAHIGKEIEVYQNMIITPLTSPEKWTGQHAFNSVSIAGWFPEEDIKDLKIINEVIAYPEKLPQYMYKLHYTKQEQIEPNFGKLTTVQLPIIIGREYNTKEDEYIKTLSQPQATKIEKAIYDGTTEDITWEILPL